MKKEAADYSASLVVAGLLTLWLLLLLWLFPLSVTSVLLGIGISGLIVLGASRLTHQFSRTSYRHVAYLLILLLGGYLILQFLPRDRYDSKPAAEVRAAVSILVQTQPIRPDFLQTTHEPPFAVITAALQKYNTELPDYSWMIRFETEDSTDETPYYLFNIRNDQAGSNYPGVVDASLSGEYFMLEVEQDGALVLYRIPLDRTLRPFTIEGIPDTPIASAATFQARIHPHMLDAGIHSGFQAAFYRLLSELYS